MDFSNHIFRYIWRITFEKWQTSSTHFLLAKIFEIKIKMNKFCVNLGMGVGWWNLVWSPHRRRCSTPATGRVSATWFGYVSLTFDSFSRRWARTAKLCASLELCSICVRLFCSSYDVLLLVTDCTNLTCDEKRRRLLFTIGLDLWWYEKLTWYGRCTKYVIFSHEILMPVKCGLIGESIVLNDDVSNFIWH